ncbi:hypothetical protein AURDEDRAFT_161399 [Auricularia subglabra TFB-10046 SS5]|nr:hypothetical protein AURDEDRAFT_161399 [Auricularia subglabra TFB-10046 SS5]
MSAVEVEVLASRLKLNPAARSTLHDFSELPAPAQMITLFAHVLGVRQGEASIADSINKTGKKLEQLQKLHVETFTPSDASSDAV